MPRWEPLLLCVVVGATASCAEDGDGDGFPPEVDCADDDPATHPGAPEYWDGKDNDCDGAVDTSQQYRWFSETEPNDALFEQCYGREGQWLGTLAPTGMVSRIDGRIDTVVPLDYDLGDLDCFAFRLAEPGVLHLQIEWPEPSADLDFAVWSTWEDGSQQAFLGSQDPGPFVTGGSSNGSLSADHTLYLWLSAYEGEPTSYRVTLWTWWESAGQEEGA